MLTRHTLAAASVAVLAALTFAAPASAQASGCRLTADTPTREGRWVRLWARQRCTTSRQRAFTLEIGWITASGRRVTQPFSLSVDGLRRNDLDANLRECEPPWDQAWDWRKDMPVKTFVRSAIRRLSGRGIGESWGTKVLKHRDSRAVDVAKLCPKELKLWQEWAAPPPAESTPTPIPTPRAESTPTPPTPDEPTASTPTTPPPPVESAEPTATPTPSGRGGRG